MEPRQGGACQPGREDFSQKSVVTRLKSHYLVEVHKVVKRVLKTVVHLELRETEMRRGPPSSRWLGQMGTTTYRPRHAMQDLGFFTGKESGLVEGYKQEDDLDEEEEKSCSWLQIRLDYGELSSYHGKE